MVYIIISNQLDCVLEVPLFFPIFCSYMLCNLSKNPYYGLLSAL
jgi:hypothetical protein